MGRNFNEWLSSFKDRISNYGYYVDFDKVYRNIDTIKIELNILNSLIGSKNIEHDFEALVSRYPETLKCVPILLAVRANEIYAADEDGEFLYHFREPNLSIEHYKAFMRKTGLFDLISNRLVSNLTDYVIGIETGLDSNGRKNRGGHLMEQLVEGFIKKSGAAEYYTEMKLSEIERKWGLDLSALSNSGKAEKRFDFVVKTAAGIYAVETNFYTGGGSKLNETARSYKALAQESAEIRGFYFVWITDGRGWLSAKGNLEEAFDATEHIYNIRDLENGALTRLFKPEGKDER